MKFYVADLETTMDLELDGVEIEIADYINLSKKDRQRVKIKAREYAIGLVELRNDDSFWYTNSIDNLIQALCREDSTVYFHNLKFDGGYIISWLLRNGYTYTHEQFGERFSFNCLVDGTGTYYSINIFFDMKSQNKYYKMTILDSMKVLPMSVEQMPKAFGMENLRKLKDTYDYYKKREQGYVLDKREIKYLKNDVLIVSKAIQFLHDTGMTKMTVASNALTEYKKTISKSRFKRAYPLLTNEEDAFIRKSYKGGFTYLNPEYAGVEVENDTVIDVNSLYPYVMISRELPYGKPYYFEGEYPENSEYPLYVQRIRCIFRIKQNKLPTIQIKNNFKFNQTQYLTSSVVRNELTGATSYEVVELTLTNVDLQLFKDHYEIPYIEYVDGYMFKSTNNLFTDYINKWNETKEKATKEKNEGMRTIAKLMLNSLYGKFGTNPQGITKYPHLVDGVVRWTSVDENDRTPLYIPVASFITSYAREKTIRTAQSIVDYSLNKYGVNKFVYSDTDSIHTLLTEDELLEIGIDIDKSKLGAWKNEGTWKYAKYLKQKTYIQVQDKEVRYIDLSLLNQEEFKKIELLAKQSGSGLEIEEYVKKNNEQINITCAGMPKGCYPYVTFENFKVGTSYRGKLMTKTVEGGPVLLPTEHTIT